VAGLEADTAHRQLWVVIVIPTPEADRLPMASFGEPDLTAGLSDGARALWGPQERCRCISA
jgi:hypothetical protein